VRVEPPSGPFSAELRLPGDKSLSHRALILAAMADGTSSLQGLGTGADVASSAAALRALGVDIDGSVVSSPGVEGWTPPSGPLDAGNSGTTMRLLAGALGARLFRTTITGDESLLARPMGRLVAPLQALGVSIDTAPGGKPPIAVGAADRLKGADVVIEVASAQVRSAFQLAAIQAEGSSAITSPPGYRDHTEKWLQSLGLGRDEGGGRFTIEPGPVPTLDIAIPGDASSAAFLWASAAMTAGAEITTQQITLNSGRTGFLEVLDAMGASVHVAVTGDVLGDPIGDVTVGGAMLTAIEVSGDLTARCLDELPLVAVIASVAQGVTTVHDAAELRIKESDRVTSTVEMITGLGGMATAYEDGFSVIGVERLSGGTVAAHGDHRLAMAAAVAAAGGDAVEIDGADVAAVSWPNFFETLEAVWSSR